MIKPLFNQFLTGYNPQQKDEKWASQSDIFRKFWYDKIIAGAPDALTDDEIDRIVKILDRNGKGNTKESEAVAKAMIAQGTWRRMFHELCTNKELSAIITNVLSATDLTEKASAIDQLYKINEGKKNSLTGPSGNAINSFLAAFDPVKNLSIISLKDRSLIVDYFHLEKPHEDASIGTRIVISNENIVNGFQAIGITGSSRTISCFCYFSAIKSLWRQEVVVSGSGETVAVEVPTNEGEASEDGNEGPRESILIQALVAEIGEKFGFTIWLPKNDRVRVLKHWAAPAGKLLDILPLQYGDIAMKTIENIDVIWLDKRTIVRAFEVEHTTSIYSGLLRMADLLAILPNIAIDLHIVAPASRREKVFEEIRRPVFSLLAGGALSEKCTYISYDSIRELAKEKNLSYLKNEVVNNFTEAAD